MPDAESPAPYLRHLAALVPEALDLAHGALTDDAGGTDARTVTVVTLRCPTTTVTEDDDVVVTAIVTPGDASTGAVYFCVDDEIVAACDVIDGRAGVTLSFDEGEHVLLAHYVGDERHHPAESSSPVTVTRAS